MPILTRIPSYVKAVINALPVSSIKIIQNLFGCSFNKANYDSDYNYRPIGLQLQCYGQFRYRLAGREEHDRHKTVQYIRNKCDGRKWYSLLEVRFQLSLWNISTWLFLVSRQRNHRYRPGGRLKWIHYYLVHLKNQLLSTTFLDFG